MGVLPHLAIGATPPHDTLDLYSSECRDAIQQLEMLESM